MSEPRESFLEQRLNLLDQAHRLRSLLSLPDTVDFTSNDTLGFSRSRVLRAEIDRQWAEHPELGLGSTGSRLLSGENPLVEALEEELARFHATESALLFNSGFDANLGLLSAIAEENDTVLYDERVHASTREGIRLSPAQSFPFRHSDLEHLESRLKRIEGRKFVAIESLYSMDGDYAPLESISALCRENGAHLIVDEAHTTGIRGPQGRGLVQDLGLEREVFARIHTFGKALGQLGAGIVGSRSLKAFLVNTARPLMYSTALPPHALIAIRCAYRKLPTADSERSQLSALIESFKIAVEKNHLLEFLPSNSPIQCLLIPGERRVRSVAHLVQKAGFDVRPILFPTVPKGSERLRITLHAFNSESEIHSLTRALKEALEEVD